MKPLKVPKNSRLGTSNVGKVAEVARPTLLTEALMTGRRVMSKELGPCKTNGPKSVVLVP